MIPLVRRPSVIKEFSERGVERFHKALIGFCKFAIAGIDLDHGPAFPAAVKRMPREPFEVPPRDVSAFRARHRDGDVVGRVFQLVRSIVGFASAMVARGPAFAFAGAGSQHLSETARSSAGGGFRPGGIAPRRWRNSILPAFDRASAGRSLKFFEILQAAIHVIAVFSTVAFVVFTAAAIVAAFFLLLFVRIP